MLVDSHCHLHLLDLTEFNGSMDEVIQNAHDAGVGHFLCVCVDPEEFPILTELSMKYPDVSISYGLHPNHETGFEPTVEDLIEFGSYPACIAIGETGLDYYRMQGDEAILFQQERFVRHIHAAKHLQKPLIIHTRQAIRDTLSFMRNEKADDTGGVMHCFSEDWDSAREALDLNFYISFSGIVTFKNATMLQEVAKKMPLDRMLIETDCPYLAPHPFRGKQNHPALVRHVAEALADLRQCSFDEIAKATTDNFNRCFRLS